MSGYYKTIKGKKYDAELLSLADGMTRGKGDGRISLSDAKKILKTVKDSNTYSDVEKATMAYIRDNYKFTPESDKWFRTEIRKWAAGKGKSAPASKTVSAVKAKISKPAEKKKPQHDSDEYHQQRLESIHLTQKISAPEPRKKGFGKIVFFIFLIGAIAAVFSNIDSIKKLFVKDKEKNKNEENISKPAEPEIVVKSKIAAEKEKLKEPEPKKTVVEKKSPTPPVEDDKNIYVVQPKDSLIGISEKLTGDYRNWKVIFEANRDIIKFPTMIFTGQKLRIPEKLNREKK